MGRSCRPVDGETRRGTRDCGSVGWPTPAKRTATSRVSDLLRSVLPEVLEDLTGRELARGAHHAAARVGPGAALVVAVDRRPVPRPAPRGQEEKNLRREELGGEDVALAQADRSLDVEGRPDLALQDELAEAREER